MFKQFNLNDRLLKALIHQKISTPTQVQIQSIPEALNGKDISVISPTGTGKTLAYLIPLIQTLIEKGKPAKGLQALIITATRELATQTQQTLQQLLSHTFFKSLLVSGGETLQEQTAKLRKNPDIIVGTPGRLLAHLKNNQLLLDQLTILVLDEVDHILKMGSGKDINLIIDYCPSNKQTLMFSATQSTEQLQISSTLLKNPVKVLIDQTNQINQNIQQQIISADDIKHKHRLLEWLLANEHYQQCIIFTNTKLQAEQLSLLFTTTRIKHTVLHNDKSINERKRTLSQMRQNQITVLIATDIASRGLDIDKLDLVINFELPNTSTEYIHRVGRTGRMDKSGLAISLISPTEQKQLFKLKKELSQSLENRVIQGLEGKPSTVYNPPSKSTPPRNKKQSKPTASQSVIISADGFAPLKRKK